MIIGRIGQGLIFRGIQEDNFYITSDRKSDTTYLWRVDTKNKDGITEGQVWTYVYDPSPCRYDTSPLEGVCNSRR